MALSTPNILRLLLTPRSTASLLRVKFCAILTAAMTSTLAYANSGLRTDFGDVLIQNVGIGATYNLRDLAGIPFKVTNSGNSTVDLVLEAQIPPDGLIPSHRVLDGYKPIPSQDWIKLSRTKFIVPAGESAYADVLITIPNDPALYGKKFQASIFSKTVGESFLNVGLWSHIMIKIAESAEVQSQAEKNRKRGLLNMDYSLIPDKVAVAEMPIGRQVLLSKQFKRDMKLANAGEEAVSLQAIPVSITDTPLTLQEGFEAGSPDWIKLKQNIFNLEPTDISELGIQVHLPKDKKLIGKKLMFVVKVAPASADIIGATFYGKIYVEVQGVEK